MHRPKNYPAHVLAAVLAAIIAASVHAPAALAAEDTPQRQLVVQGEGVVTGAPDLAVIRAGVVTEAATATEALAGNGDAMSKLFQTLDQFGVAGRDRQTAGLNINPVHSRGAPQEPSTLTGYRVENQVAIRVRRIARLGSLLDQLVKSGANRVHGVQFTFANPAGMQDEARKRAVAEARRRAAIYAAEAGVALGRVISISGPASSGTLPAPRALAAMSADRAVPMAPGELEVRITVTVIFAIE